MAFLGCRVIVIFGPHEDKGTLVGACDESMLEQLPEH
jgi:hypothetical protein